MKNRRVVLAAHVRGVPRESDFRLEEVEASAPAEGQVLVRTVFVTVDPGMRGRMSGEASYTAPVPIGGILGGPTVGRVVASRDPQFQIGDWVATASGWQEYALCDGPGLRRIDDLRLSPSLQIGVLGIPGLTAYVGLLDIGRPEPGETVLVSSAAGAVGSAAGQIARIKGAKAVGIAGGERKCRWLVEELGFTAAIDRHAEPDLAAAVARTCPEGVDVLFDNVGTTVIDPVLPLMRRHGRIVCSGRIGDYHIAEADQVGLKNTGFFVTARLKMQGLIASDHAHDFAAARGDLTDWVLSGELRHREDIDEGIERLPAAFIGLFEGENFGRKLVRLGAD